MLGLYAKDTSRPTLRDTAAEVLAARQRIGAIASIKRRIGIIRMWPDQAVAEHENVERIRTAAALIGVDVVELDRNGYVLDSPKAMVSRDDVDFVIHLHFETPKAYDVPSIAAMWNPISFYFDWGFEAFWANQMSHDMFAWTGSAEIKNLIAQERGVSFADAMPLFNHSLAEPIFEPSKRSKFEIFYCGINWEKISGKPGRHDDVLRALDRAGKLALYGPERVQGVHVWEGYKSYCGSIPFDGRTLIEKIAEAGVCLVFSSDAHKSSGIMSNRLFEALSAGAVVIGDEHPFIRHALGDNFIEAPSHLPSDQRAKIILDAVKDLAREPERAYEMARRAQDIFVEKYFLCSQVASLYESFVSFSNKKNEIVDRQEEVGVDVVVQVAGLTGEKIVSALSRLSNGLGKFANIILLCSKNKQDWFERHCGCWATIAPNLDEEFTILAPADTARLVKPFLRSKKMWLTNLTDEVFFTQFICAVVALRNRYVGRLGHLLFHTDDHGNTYYDYRSGDLSVERFHEAARSAFIFDTEWLLENIAPSNIGWRQCVRIAESQEQGIAIDQPSSVKVDVKSFEKNFGAGYREKIVSGEHEFARRIGISRNYSSDTSSIRTYIPRPAEYSLEKGTLNVAQDAVRILSTILGNGWHNAEADLVWSSLESADLWLRLPPSMTKLRFHVSGNPHVESGRQDIEVLVNSTSVGQVQSIGGGSIVIEVDTSCRPWLSDEMNQVSLVASGVAVPPAGSGDLRRLGVCLKRIEAE